MAIWTAALSRVGAELLLLIAVVAQFFCGMASVAANSRMLFAFSRDGAVPGHRLWHRINPRTRTPTSSIWFCVVFSFLLAVPVLWSGVAYAPSRRSPPSGSTSPDVLQMLRRIRGSAGRRRVLRRWSPLVGWVGILWVAFIAVLFMLPRSASAPSTGTTPRTPPWRWVSCCSSRAALASQCPQVVQGPKTQGDEAQLQKIEAEFSNIEHELEDVTYRPLPDSGREVNAGSRGGGALVWQVLF